MKRMRRVSSSCWVSRMGCCLAKMKEEHSAAGGNVAKEGAQGPMHCPVRESNSILKGRKVHKGSLSCKPPITAKLQN